jgi:hypothetical protein
MRIDLPQASWSAAPAWPGDESTVSQGEEKRDRARASLITHNGAAPVCVGKRKSNGFLSLLGNFLGQQRPQCFVPILVTSGSRSLSGIKCR